MNLVEIKKAIKEWSNVRTSPEKVLTYFKQGCCFKIKKSQFEQWNKNSPENLHAYLGIFEGKLKFVLIDSESDKNPVAHMDSIFVQDYLKGLSKTEERFIDKASDGDLTVSDALKKMMQWNVFIDTWVNNMAHTIPGIFKAFVVPFRDLKSQFGETSNPESVVFLGLNDDNQADLILWGLDISQVQQITALKGGGGIPVENLVIPVPPYGGEDLGLL